MPQDNHSDCVKNLEEAQQADFDNREMVREADLFLNKRDGQWEPQIIAKFSGKPRYTFDECNPIVDDIMGEMETAEFDIHVDPASGEAAKDIAEVYEGIIRNIENISKAKFVYNHAARIMVGTGLSGWRVVSDFRDEDSFQQDLMIRTIPNFVDCVWFDPGFTMQDASDANHAYVLTSLTRAEYDKKYPKGSGLSIGQSRRSQAYSYKKPNEVVIGEYLYKKRFDRELVLLTNGAVVPVDDDFLKIKDEWAAAGIRVHDSRKRPYYRVYQKLFDGGDWLKDAEKTVFDSIPIIPVFGNFKISENKVIYWGITEKLADAQRIINYAESRKIEEGALSPKPKTWMTKQQAKSPDVIRSLRTLNVNTEPVQFYDHVEGQAPPYQQQAFQVNPGLVETSQAARSFIERSSSTFDEARGRAPAQRSGVAIGLLQQKSDNPKRKWFTSVEIALNQTFNVLIKAIPRVYNTRQQMRLMGQDGSTKTITIKDLVRDEQTNEIVEIMDLSKGAYSVTCSAGPAFTSRQQETVTTITELSAVDPSIIQIGSDVLLNNINAPGIDQIAERKRAQMVAQGIIPPDQLTDDEKAKLSQQQQQPKQPDPMMVAAQAEMAKAQAAERQTQARYELESQKNQIKMIELQLEQEKQDRAAMLEAVKLATEEIKANADALKTIRDAMGADSIVSPPAIASYEAQARNLRRSVTGPTNQ